jgi:hypothetical protein
MTDVNRSRANNDECPVETDAVARVLVPPGEGSNVVTSHVCACGSRVTVRVNPAILSRFRKNFPNMPCPDCELTTFGSTIIEVTPEWASMSNTRYDRTGSQIIVEVIKKKYGIYATEDFTQATDLQASFSNIDQLEGGYFVQPHWVSRAERSLTSSNYTDLSSAMTGFTAGRQRVEFLRGPSLDGKLVEALAVEAIKRNGLGSEGIQLVGMFRGPDGLVSEIYTKTDAYIENDEGKNIPVEMFLGSPRKILHKLKKKLSQLASVVRADGSDYGYLVFFDYNSRDKTDTKFGLVRLDGPDLVAWVDGEVESVSMLYDAVRHLLEPVSGSEGALA